MKECQSENRAEKKNARSAAKAQKNPRTKRLGESLVCRQPVLNAGRTLESDAEVSPLALLFETLEKEKIRFLIAGMSAAVLQGVPYTTLDTDIWMNLEPRQYIRVLNFCRKLGAEVVANTVVVLEDGTTVNFLYRVDGLKTFLGEYRKAIKLKWLGRQMRALSVEQILQSKEAVGRPKDLAHLPILKLFLKCRDE